MKLKDFFRKEVKQQNETPKIFSTTNQMYSENIMSMFNYFKNWSGICANKRADAISGIENYVMIKNSKGEFESASEEHWLSQLIKSPNKPAKLTFNEIKRQKTLWLDFNGNAYIYTPLNGYKYPTQMWVLPSNVVKPIPGMTSLIDEYEIQTSKGMMRIPPYEICHIKTIMPSLVWEKNYLIGSPIRLYGALDSITADYQIKEFIKKHFQQEALSPVILRGDFPNEETYQTFKQNLTNKTLRATVIANVDKSVDFLQLPQSNLAQSTANSQFATDFNAKQIAAAFGIPFGMLDTTSQQNKATADVNYMQFRNETIEPLMLSIESSLTEHFQQFEPNVYIKHDSYQYTDSQNELERLKLVVQANAITINELRESYNLEPIAEGDVLINTSVNTDLITQPIKSLKKKV